MPVLGLTLAYLHLLRNISFLFGAPLVCPRTDPYSCMRALCDLETMRLVHMHVLGKVFKIPISSAI